METETLTNGSAEALAITNAAAKQAPAKPAMFYVMDSTAPHGAKRSHEIIVKKYEDGRDPLTKKYSLGSDEPGEPMPMDHAFKFLTDKAFIVMAPDGRRITPPPKVDGGTGGYELPVHQTIADWDEIITSALFKRTQITAGGEAITQTSTRAEMIQFLVSSRKAQAGVSPDDAAVALAARMAEGPLDGQLGNDGLNKLFGGESPLLETLRAQGSASVGAR